MVPGLMWLFYKTDPTRKFGVLWSVLGWLAGYYVDLTLGWLGH